MKFYDEYAHDIAAAAQKTVLYEVAAAIKPGLVDRLGRGAHKDMDIFTFMASASSIYRGMYGCALTGLNDGKDPFSLLEKIRPIGMDCEKSMLKATGGVNTHKGIIFSMGILCAAAGSIYNEMPGEKIIKAEDTCTRAALICRGLVEKDFSRIKEKANPTHGERLFMEYGITGIRGEAQGGFRTVLEKGVAVLRNDGLRKSLSLNDLVLHTLMSIMTCCEDTNVVIRGGLEGLKLVQKCAAEFMASGGMLSEDSKECLQEMDRLFVRKNLSPGGSADLLSLSLFLADMEGISL